MCELLGVLPSVSQAASIAALANRVDPLRNPANVYMWIIRISFRHQRGPAGCASCLQLLLMHASGGVPGQSAQPIPDSIHPLKLLTGVLDARQQGLAALENAFTSRPGCRIRDASACGTCVPRIGSRRFSRVGTELSCRRRACARDPAAEACGCPVASPPRMLALTTAHLVVKDGSRRYSVSG